MTGLLLYLNCSDCLGCHISVRPALLYGGEREMGACHRVGQSSGCNSLLIHDNKLVRCGRLIDLIKKRLFCLIPLAVLTTPSLAHCDAGG